MSAPTSRLVEKRLRAAYESQLITPLRDENGNQRGIPRSIKSLAKGLPQWRSGHLSEHDDPWVWSDQHVGHARIIEYSNRPFESLEEMDAAFFANWEAAVGDDDTVVFVGDLAVSNRGLNEETFRRVQELPGARKILVVGNHDVTARGGDLRVKGFDTMYAMMFAQGDPPLVLTHVPLREVLEGWVNVHGHTHGTPSGRTPHINVSVEHLDYRPVRLARLRALAKVLVTGRYPEGKTTNERLAAIEAA